MARASLRERLGVAVVCFLILAFVPPAQETGDQAHLRSDITHVGPLPANVSFAVFDADTGEFLYALSRQACPHVTLPAWEERADGTVILHHYTMFRTRWDVGPAMGPETIDHLRADTEKMYRSECERSPPSVWGSQAVAVYSEAGHFPQWGGSQRLTFWDTPFHLPVGELGAPYIKEHRVTVIGDSVEVHVWSGVGEKNWSCRMVDPDGQPVSGTFHPNDPNESGRVAFLCVNFRYLGDLPESLTKVGS